MKYYYSAISNHTFIRSVVTEFFCQIEETEIIKTIKSNMFDIGISSNDPFVIWCYDGKEIKSILTNSPGLQDYEQEQYTEKERLDFVET